MGKRMFGMLIVVGIIFGGIFGYHAFGNYMMKQHFATMKAPPVVVSTVKAGLQLWQPRIKAAGSLRAVQGVDVACEIPGIVEAIYFKSGDDVSAGQVLVDLNAQADVAQLQALQAASELAQTVYDRDRKQFEIQAVSQAVVDADAAELKSRKAQEAQQAALVAKKKIKAAFAGKLGISSVNPGQYLNPGEKIVTLQALDTVYADFYLPQQALARLSIGQDVNVTVDTFPGRVFSGKITAINTKIEQDTRNVQAEATLPNPRHELLPGMFASVEVETGAAKDHLTLPQTAVTFNPYGETVYIVDGSEKDAKGAVIFKARQTFVTVGETRGDQLSVLKGIKEGDVIVSSGQHKLKNGSVVIINDQLQPGNDPAPQPVDQ
ncbi:MAG: efflux RND transporter periplasmic adaptor subunit [Candidatus Omnitrophica bacterium]|nr:efflux RND transporter periplasmic adaptor subunit [Candidatus Omnitrophota bacterium]